MIFEDRILKTEDRREGVVQVVRREDGIEMIELGRTENVLNSEGGREQKKKNFPFLPILRRTRRQNGKENHCLVDVY
jgi:hypothetical protein